MDVRLPDGTIIQNVPDNMSRADLVTKLKSNGMAVPADWLQSPAPQSATPIETSPSFGKQLNSAISDIPRQIGLTGRYALEGPAQALQMFTEPVAGLMRSAGIPTKPLSQIATEAADWAGLPKPHNSLERVVGDATRLVAGSGGMLGASQQVAKLPGMIGEAGKVLASNPMAQLTSSAGAGATGGLSREAGGSDLQQAGAALVGGVAGGLVPGLATSAANAGKRAINAGRQLVNAGMTPAQMDVQIEQVLSRAGVDYSQVPERARQALRQELGSALHLGKELDPTATARLAEFRQLGITPTRGMVTQDPVLITREMNLAKTGANASDTGLQGLARVQNQNNNRLIDLLNESGAARGDAYAAGQQAIGAIRGKDASLQQQVSGLYNAARSMPGGDTPLNRSAVVNGIYDALAKQNKLAYLPDNIANMLNTISEGQVTRNGQSFNVPFNANVLDNLMTDIATAQRSTTDGNVKAALKIAREALDGTPIQPIKTHFGGNQLVTEQGAQYLRSKDAEAGKFMDALLDAKSAARSRFQWQESSRPVDAALSGVAPDGFVKKFVLGGTVDDARALVRELGSPVPPGSLVDPRNPVAPQGPGIDAIKNAITAHLKDKAMGGQADEVGKFSAAAYNRALNQIGDRKLSLFFQPDELTQLKSIGRVSSLMMNQPVGSAVNNSNSGALLLGRGLDMLNSVPVIGPLAGPAVQNIRVGVQQRAAQNVLPGLLVEQPRESLARGLLSPSAVYGAGLLSAP